MRLRYHDRLEDLYKTTRHEFFTYALAITGNIPQAEDAIHSAFERLLSSKRRPLNLRPYAFRSIRNAALDQRSKPTPESVVPITTNNDDPRRVSEHNEVEEMLKRLSDNEAEAITLKLYGGLSFREIGNVCDVPLHTAASWYRRGIEKLRTLYEEPDHERQKLTRQTEVRTENTRKRSSR